MGAPMHVLLTNDDGIASPGIQALYEALSSFAEVTVVAPRDDQSAVGRAISREVTIEEMATGYAVRGTPADCVITGIEALDLSPTIVISGCNRGANLGTSGLGRSGTVSAAIEATYFDVPAIAVSLYIPEDEWPRETTDQDYTEAVRATRYLVETTLDVGVFETVDYLNVNVPLPRSDRPKMVPTLPSQVYDMTVERNGQAIALRDRTWEQMISDDVIDPPGTDRRSVVEGNISVSPLSTPTIPSLTDTMRTVTNRYSIEYPDSSSSSVSQEN